MVGFIHSVKRWGITISEYSYNNGIVIATELVTVTLKDESPYPTVTVTVRDYNENVVFFNSYRLDKSLSNLICDMDEDVMLNPYITKSQFEEWEAIIHMLAFC